MTALELTFYISLAFFLQIAIFSARAFYRHWRIYQDLKASLAEYGAGLPVPHHRETAAPAIMDETALWEGFRELQVIRKEFEDKNHSICSFYLKFPDNAPLPTFRPGQYLTFQINVIDPETGQDKWVTRCYSLSDRPGLDYYRVSIKRVPPPQNRPDLPPGLASSYFHDNVEEGGVLQVRAPGGRFYLEEGDAPIVLIAGGIGVTPMISMLNTCLHTGTSREIWLFYGVRNGNEVIMKEYLEKLAYEHSNFHLRICYSDPLPSDELDRNHFHKGYVDITLLRLSLSLRPYQFYICGPGPMLEAMVPALEDWGVAEANIHYEAFGPASLARPQSQETEKDTASNPVSVTFSRSGKTVTWDGNELSLLDLAEKNGIEVEAGCRAGGCGLCQTTIEEGEVKYLQSPDYSPESGCCLLCISQPVRDLTLKM